MKGICFALVLLCVGVVQCVDYQPGDIVRLSKRSTHEKTMTPWSPITSAICPRFLHEKTVELSSVSDDILLSQPNQRTLPGATYRFMLSFEDHKFISPWFALKDYTRGQTLVMINVVFVYNGLNILDVKWDPDYDDHGDHGDTQGIKPVIVNYSWEQFSEEDVSFGIAGILIFGLVSSCGMLIYIFFSESERLSSVSEDLPSVFGSSSTSSYYSQSSEESLYSPPPLHQGFSSMSIPTSRRDKGD